MSDLAEYMKKNDSITAMELDEIETQKHYGAIATSDDIFSKAFKSEIDAQLDMFSLKNLYFSEQWVYIICNVIARKVSRQVMRVEREVISQGEITSVPYGNHPMTDLLWRPNDFEAYTSFIYRLVSELMLMGNAVVWKLRFSNQMILLPTELLTIEFDKYRRIEHYVVNAGSTEDFNGLFDGALKIDPQDIVHFRMPNLASMIWGLSSFIPGRKSILFDRYTQDYLLNFYAKQANPGPIMELTKDANEKQAFKLLKSIELKHQGRQNQRKTMILPKGVTAKNLTQTMAEQQLKIHLDDNRDTIRALLAVPPHLFGTQKSGSLGSEETNFALKNFWETTLIPVQDLVSDAFTMGFSRLLGNKLFLKFDNSNVIVLQEDLGKRADVANKMLSTHTLNEVRKKIYKDPALPGGDETPGKQQELGGFAQFSKDEVSTKDEKSLISPSSERLKKFLDKNSNWWTIRKKNEQEQIEKNEREILEGTLDVFSSMAPKALASFKKVFGSSKKENIKTKTKQDDLETALNDAFSEFDSVWVDSNVKTLQSSQDLGYDLSLDVPFNIPNEAEREALRLENDEGRKAQMEARALENFSGVTKTTTNDILGIVERGTNRSATLDQISQDIQTYFKEIVPSRARTIARTETLGAASAGQKAALDDASEVIPGMKKLWLASGDSRVRDSHADLDGHEVDADKKFANGLEYPRDPLGSANEIINCRCSFLMMPPGEDLDTEGVDFTGLS